MMEQNGNGATTDLRFDEDMCERYLFGELNEAEKEKFEAAYFDDDVFFDRFIAVKTELLDLYARGELEPEKLARMEPHFLATAPRRRRLAESSEFITAVNAISNRDNHSTSLVVKDASPSFLDSLVGLFTLPRFATAAALLLAGISGIYLLSRGGQEGPIDTQLATQPRPAVLPEVGPLPAKSNNPEDPEPKPQLAVKPPDSKDTTPRRAPGRPKADLARTPKTKLPTQPPLNDTQRDRDRKYVAVDSPEPQTGTFVILPEASITLKAGATRNIGAANTLTLPARAQSAAITLFFRSERYVKYIVTITDVEGNVIFRNADYDNRAIQDMKDGTKQLTARLEDASRLGEKDYIVKLEGHIPGAAPEIIEEYYFQVRRVTKSSTAGDPSVDPFAHKFKKP